MSSLKNRLQAQYASVSSQTPKLQFLELLHLLRVKSVRKVAYPVRYKRVATVLYLHTTTSCYCCSAYLSSCYRTASDANLLDDPYTFHCVDYFVIGEIRTCLKVSDHPMFLWISSNSCPLNLLLVRSHQAEIIIVKRLIQGRNSVTRVRVEPRSIDQGRRKNDPFTLSATLPTSLTTLSYYIAASASYFCETCYFAVFA